MLEVKTHQSTSEHLRSSAEVLSSERKALFTLRFLHYGYASALLVERLMSCYIAHSKTVPSLGPSDQPPRNAARAYANRRLSPLSLLPKGQE